MSNWSYPSSWLPPKPVSRKGRERYDAMTPAEIDAYASEAMKRLHKVIAHPVSRSPKHMRDACVAWMTILEYDNGHMREHLIKHMLAEAPHSGSTPWKWACDYANGAFVL